MLGGLDHTQPPAGVEEPARAAARPLILATLFVIGIALLLPYSPLAGLLGLAPLPPAFLAAMLALVGMYASAEFVRRYLFKRYDGEPERQASGFGDVGGLPGGAQVGSNKQREPDRVDGAEADPDRGHPARQV